MSHCLFQLKLPISSTTPPLFLHPNPIAGICSVLQYPTNPGQPSPPLYRRQQKLPALNLRSSILLMSSLDENQLGHIIRGSATHIQTSQTTTSNTAINSTRLPNSWNASHRCGVQVEITRPLLLWDILESGHAVKPYDLILFWLLEPR